MVRVGKDRTERSLLDRSTDSIELRRERLRLTAAFRKSKLHSLLALAALLVAFIGIQAQLPLTRAALSTGGRQKAISYQFQ